MNRTDAEKAAKWGQLFANKYYYALRMKFEAVEENGIIGVGYSRGNGKHAAYSIDPPVTRKVAEDLVLRQVNEVILHGI